MKSEICAARNLSYPIAFAGQRLLAAATILSRIVFLGQPWRGKTLEGVGKLQKGHRRRRRQRRWGDERGASFDVCSSVFSLQFAKWNYLFYFCQANRARQQMLPAGFERASKAFPEGKCCGESGDLFAQACKPPLLQKPFRNVSESTAAGEEACFNIPKCRSQKAARPATGLNLSKTTMAGEIKTAEKRLLDVHFLGSAPRRGR